MDHNLLKTRLNSLLRLIRVQLGKYLLWRGVFRIESKLFMTLVRFTNDLVAGCAVCSILVRFCFVILV